MPPAQALTENSIAANMVMKYLYIIISVLLLMKSLSILLAPKVFHTLGNLRFSLVLQIGVIKLFA
jgi:hypothetical protein